MTAQSRLVATIVIASAMLIACTAKGPVDTPPTAAPTQTKAEAVTPSLEPTQIQVAPTNTPLPPPPTPTPRPTPTSLPTSTPAPAASDQDKVPTPSPTPSPPPIADVMVEVSAGVFVMGSDSGDPEDAPAHQVDLPAFEIDRFEVTNDDFAAFVEATGYETDAERDGKKNWRDSYGEGKENHPVVRVTWNDAAAYCAWLDKRLPSEAEWEKAARGAEEYRFPWGNEWDPARANTVASGLRGTTAVGSYGAGASPYGVEDMAGNVWEWTADWYQPYPGNAVNDPYYGEKCRVTRGGGWFDGESQAVTYSRNCADPDKTAIDELGFRCVR